MGDYNKLKQIIIQDYSGDWSDGDLEEGLSIKEEYNDENVIKNLLAEIPNDESFQKKFIINQESDNEDILKNLLRETPNCKNLHERLLNNQQSDDKKTVKNLVREIPNRQEYNDENVIKNLLAEIPNDDSFQEKFIINQESDNVDILKNLLRETPNCKNLHERLLNNQQSDDKKTVKNLVREIPNRQKVPVPKILTSDSYCRMITKAILSSPGRCISLQKLFAFISENYPSFSKQSKKWQAPIENYLCHSNHFVKALPLDFVKGSPEIWILNPATEKKMINRFNRRESKKLQEVTRLNNADSLNEDSDVIDLSDSLSDDDIGKDSLLGPEDAGSTSDIQQLSKNSAYLVNQRRLEAKKKLNIQNCTSTKAVSLNGKNDERISYEKKLQYQKNTIMSNLKQTYLSENNSLLVNSSSPRSRSVLSIKQFPRKTFRNYEKVTSINQSLSSLLNEKLLDSQLNESNKQKICTERNKTQTKLERWFDQTFYKACNNQKSSVNAENMTMDNRFKGGKTYGCVDLTSANKTSSLNSRKQSNNTMSMISMQNDTEIFEISSEDESSHGNQETGVFSSKTCCLDSNGINLHQLNTDSVNGSNCLFPKVTSTNLKNGQKTNSSNQVENVENCVGFEQISATNRVVQLNSADSGICKFLPVTGNISPTSTLANTPLHNVPSTLESTPTLIGPSTLDSTLVFSTSSSLSNTLSVNAPASCAKIPALIAHFTHVNSPPPLSNFSNSTNTCSLGAPSALANTPTPGATSIRKDAHSSDTASTPTMNTHSTQDDTILPTSLVITSPIRLSPHELSNHSTTPNSGTHTNTASNLLRSLLFSSYQSGNLERARIISEKNYISPQNDLNPKSNTNCMTDLLLNKQKQFEIKDLDGVNTKIRKHTGSIFCECYECKKSNNVLKETMSNDIKCNECDLTFSSIINLKKHINNHSGLKNYVCVQCCRGFSTKYSLGLHRKMVHSSSELLTCSTCKKLFKGPRSLTTHVKRYHKNEASIPTACDLCQKMFKNKYQMRDHRRRYHLSDKLICNDCSSTFRNRRTLIDHVKLHMPPSDKCTICSELFHSKNMLNIHMRTQHMIDNRKTYICEVCGKATKSKWQLKTHMLIHKRKKPYICEECGKSFRTVTNLIQHSVTHSGNRQFSCGHCKKSFRLRHHLRQHMAVHGLNTTAKYGKRKLK